MDEEILRSILRKARSPMWWARLSYPDNPKFWSENERNALKRAFGKASECEL